MFRGFGINGYPLLMVDNPVTFAVSPVPFAVAQRALESRVFSTDEACPQ
jgi:hypothetical protein